MHQLPLKAHCRSTGHDSRDQMPFLRLQNPQEGSPANCKARESPIELPRILKPAELPSSRVPLTSWIGVAMKVSVMQWALEANRTRIRWREWSQHSPAIVLRHTCQIQYTSPESSLTIRLEAPQVLHHRSSLARVRPQHHDEPYHPTIRRSLQTSRKGI